MSHLRCTAENVDIADCTCPDVDARLKTGCDSPYVAFKWCRTCDKHYARCRCATPAFYVRCGGQELPVPEGGFQMADGSRHDPDLTTR